MLIDNIPTLPVADLDAARHFYIHVLGCLPAERGDSPAGDTGDAVVALDFMGHPLVLLGASEEPAPSTDDHVGACPSSVAFILGVDDWCTTSERLRAHDIEVVVAPARRFSVVPGEQCAMTIEDPDGNCIVLRGFAAEAGLLAA